MGCQSSRDQTSKDTKTSAIPEKPNAKLAKIEKWESKQNYYKADVEKMRNV